MEHNIRPLSPNTHAKFKDRAKAASLALADVDEALIGYQIDTMGQDAGEALIAQQEARMQEYWRNRDPPTYQ